MITILTRVRRLSRTSTTTKPQGRSKAPSASEKKFCLQGELTVVKEGITVIIGWERLAVQKVLEAAKSLATVVGG